MQTIKHWRDMARFFSGGVSNENDNLEEIIRSRYRHWQAIQNSTSPHLRLAWAAVGLMTYGDANVIEDAILNIPPLPESHEGSMSKFLCEIIAGLLPTAGELQSHRYVRAHPDELLDWFKRNQERLSWDEHLYKFVLAENSE
jgi:hypothetical protein